jgi:hypothetical protein
MYPDDQSIELFGEAVPWPGVGEDGKFTNGSFSDPEVKPSFIPAETLNLVLDNLSELLTSLGKAPNNADPSQLKAAVAAALALKSPLAGPVFTGVPKVPGKASAAANDGTLIATEAQVYLKANTASPALAGIPTAPTAAAKTSNTQIATTAYADRAGHPVGSFYTQYPESGQSTIADMFPSTKSPATLFGGTWTERFASEDVFFRTGALGGRRGQTWDDAAKAYTATGATAGVEPDAIRNIKAGFSDVSHLRHTTQNAQPTGAFVPGIVTNAAANVTYSNTSISGIDASRDVPADTANHPKNRLIKVWERTA